MLLRSNEFSAFWRRPKWLIIILSLCLVGCSSIWNTPIENATDSTEYEVSREPDGCEGIVYPDPETSPYVVPFAVGETFEMGLTNCTSSYHSAGRPDEYAYDFDVPIGTPFVAARAGTVSEVVENESSSGGGGGNYVYVDHHDGTVALYYHSPADGIEVEVGDEVEQGDLLGVTGRSGLAGYPHLHFIVVEDPPTYPYKGIPVTFSNVSPADLVLQTNGTYTAVSYP